MATLGYDQVFRLAKQAGFTEAEAKVMTAIAYAESRFVTDAMGDTTITTSKWGPSVGLWQIRSVKAESGKQSSRDATQLTDPMFNARSAYKVAKTEGGLKAWSVYADGKYRQYLDRDKVVAAGGGVNAGPVDGVVADVRQGASDLEDSINDPINRAVSGLGADIRAAFQFDKAFEAIKSGGIVTGVFLVGVVFIILALVILLRGTIAETAGKVVGKTVKSAIGSSK